MTPRPFAFALALLSVGCGPRPVTTGPTPGTARDSVIVAGTAEIPADLVRDGALTFTDGARFSTVTVGEFALLQAETDAQRAAAQRAIDSGMSLRDPARLLQLLDTGAERRDAVLGQATLPTPIHLDRPFTSEAVFRMTPSEGHGVCAGTGVCDRVAFRMRLISDPGPLADNVRRMPSSLAVELDGPRSHVEDARLLLGIGNETSSTVAEAELSNDDRSRPIHRLRLDYTPGHVRVTLNGTEIMSQPVSLGGPPAHLSLNASAGPDGPGLVVTSWRVVQP